jgi:hypothetical protein
MAERHRTAIQRKWTDVQSSHDSANAHNLSFIACAPKSSLSLKAIKLTLYQGVLFIKLRSPHGNVARGPPATPPPRINAAEHRIQEREAIAMTNDIEKSDSSLVKFLILPQNNGRLFRTINSNIRTSWSRSPISANDNIPPDRLFLSPRHPLLRHSYK